MKDIKVKSAKPFYMSIGGIRVLVTANGVIIKNK
jgi:hypothetical protein